jgi:hypothetical protein
MLSVNGRKDPDGKAPARMIPDGGDERRGAETGNAPPLLDSMQRPRVEPPEVQAEGDAHEQAQGPGLNERQHDTTAEHGGRGVEGAPGHGVAQEGHGH